MRAQGLVSLVLPLLLLGGLSGLQACSGFPRVVVLHDPLTPEEHMTLGATYEAQGAHDLAAREYRAAMTDRTDYVPALVALGNFAFDSGALDEAEEDYRHALASHPDHPGASNNLAMVYLKRGDRLDQAERLALKASAQDGSFRPYALDTLAHIYTRTGRYQEAQAALAEADAAVPAANQTLRERLAHSRPCLAPAWGTVEAPTHTSR
jgi:tetratricopeptide (TPR) repeat protein